MSNMISGQRKGVPETVEESDVDRCDRSRSQNRTTFARPARAAKAIGNVEIRENYQSYSNSSGIKLTKMPAEKLLDPRLKPVMIVNNASSQALMKDHEANAGMRNNVSEESIEMNQGHRHNIKSPNYVSRADWLTLAILTFVNLINYMDRYTIAGKSLNFLNKFIY